MSVRRLLPVAPALAIVLFGLTPIIAQAGAPGTPTPTSIPSPEQTPVLGAGCGEQVAPLCAADCGPLSACIPLDLLIPGAPGCVCEPPTPTPPPPTPTPHLNHFQCYDVGRQAFDPFDLSLADDFGPSTVEVRRPKLLCAPVDKNGDDPTAPDDPDHLVGYEIRRNAPRFEGVHDEIAEDQFGTMLLDLRRPERLLVPAAKSVTGPATPLDPAVVDHYQCYRVRGDRRRVSGVTVEDQFTENGPETTDVKKPLRLCLPVDKDGEGILDAAARLMCYRIKPGPRVNQEVWFDDQLGAGILKVRRARELCVPVATPTPLASSTPTPPPTPTATPTALPCGSADPLFCSVGTCPPGEVCSAGIAVPPLCGCFPGTVGCNDAIYPTCGLGECPGGLTCIDFLGMGCICSP